MGPISKTSLIQYSHNQEQELVPYALFDGYATGQKMLLDTALDTKDLAISAPQTESTDSLGKTFGSNQKATYSLQMQFVVNSLLTGLQNQNANTELGPT
jgi:hypothetical protein